MSLWSDEDEDLDYYDPDPNRHDANDICCCGHLRDDHTHSDDGCARRWCTCTWYREAVNA